MKIDISLLTDNEKIELSHEYDPETEELHHDDCYYRKALSLRGWALKQNDSVRVEAHIESECAVTCSRCLEVYALPIDIPFTQVYDGKGKQSIDITEDVREYVIFTHDQKYLCRVDCKGICVHCGINLNKQSCTCSDEAEGNVFSQAFKKYKNKKEKEK